MALEKGLRVQMADIEHALHKIKEGTYGLCDICGQPIAPERLEALPWANLCYRCKLRPKNQITISLSEQSKPPIKSTEVRIC
jgi:RNA polymerase-binding transcription factor DksA